MAGKFVDRLKRDRQFAFTLIVVAMVLLILGTRVLGLRHGVDLHRDDYKFSEWAASVVYGDFEANFPDYPNGAIIFQIPFHLVGRMLGTFLGGELPLWAVGRFSSVVYFTLGAVLGIRLCWRLSKKNLWAAGAYAAIMVFSLIHMEQSRYSTGDPISLFVVMCIFTLLDIYIREKNRFYLLFASFMVGALAAVKFPLVLFLIFPLAAVFGGKREGEPGERKSRLQIVIYILLLMVAGFLVFTPKIFEDPAFIQRVIFKEMGNYITAPDVVYDANPLNNFLGALVYHLLYAEFPLALPIAVFGVVGLNRQNRQDGGVHVIYTRVLPVFTLFFLVYNCFAGEMFYRSIYPFFYLCNIYTALGVAYLMREKRVLKLGVAALGAFMVLRGGIFTYSLMQPSHQEQAIQAVLNHENYDNKNIIVDFGMDYWMYERIPERQYVFYLDERDNTTGEGYRLKPGEYGISTSVENWYARKRILPDGIDPLVNERLARWDEAQAANQPYHFAQLGSRWETWLYGGWLVGSTLPEYEFPMYQVYYNPDTAVSGTADKMALYNELYAIEDPQEYLARLAEMENITVMVTGQWLDLFEMEELAGYLPIDAANMPVDEQFAYAMVMDGQGNIKFEEYSAGELRVPATELVGAECELYSGIGVPDSILVDGREYSRHFEGLNVVVYDADFGCVMDWYSLFYADGEVHFIKLPPV